MRYHFIQQTNPCNIALEITRLRKSQPQQQGHAWKNLVGFWTSIYRQSQLKYASTTFNIYKSRKGMWAPEPQLQIHHISKICYAFRQLPSRKVCNFMLHDNCRIPALLTNCVCHMRLNKINIVAQATTKLK